MFPYFQYKHINDTYAKVYDWKRYVYDYKKQVIVSTWYDEILSVWDDIYVADRTSWAISLWDENTISQTQYNELQTILNTSDLDHITSYLTTTSPNSAYRKMYLDTSKDIHMWNYLLDHPSFVAGLEGGDFVDSMPAQLPSDVEMVIYDMYPLEYLAYLQKNNTEWSWAARWSDILWWSSSSDMNSWDPLDTSHDHSLEIQLPSDYQNMLITNRICPIPNSVSHPVIDLPTTISPEYIAQVDYQINLTVKKDGRYTIPVWYIDMLDTSSLTYQTKQNSSWIVSIYLSSWDHRIPAAINHGISMQIPNIDNHIYKQFVKSQRDWYEQLGKIITLPQKLSTLLKLLKDVTLQEKIIWVQNIVAKHFWYDMYEKDLAMIKRGKTLEQKMQIMVSRADSLYAQWKISQDIYFAWVCNDVSIVRMAMFRELGVLSGINHGLAVEDGVSDWSMAHATTFVCYPIADGVAHREIDWRGGEWYSTGDDIYDQIQKQLAQIDKELKSGENIYQQWSSTRTWTLSTDYISTQKINYQNEILINLTQLIDMHKKLHAQHASSDFLNVAIKQKRDIAQDLWLDVSWLDISWLDAILVDAQ